MTTVVVRTVSDFAVLNDNTSYVFTKDIDLPLTAAPTYSGAGIGIIVDGSGYAITIVGGPGEWSGLFTRPVTVRNLGIKSGSGVFTGAQHGWFYRDGIGGSATNCYSNGIISSNGGGIFGGGSSGSATNCYSTGIIQAGGGGIFGLFCNGSATNCYSTGFITGDAGGIYGYASTGNATKCYSTGSIAGTGGGIFGSYCSGTATNCYSTGSIVGGGIVGGNSNVIATNCYSIGNIIAGGGGIFASSCAGSATNCYTTGNIGTTSGIGVCGDYFTGGTTSIRADNNNGKWSDANAKSVLSNTPTVWYYKDGANKPWTFGTKPTAPTALTAVVTKTTAKLTWTAPVFLGPSVTYTLLQNGVPVSLSKNTAITVTLTNLKPGASYTWSVAAVNSMGTGPAVSITKKLPLKHFPIKSVIQKAIDF